MLSKSDCSAIRKANDGDLVRVDMPEVLETANGSVLSVDLYSPDRERAELREFMRKHGIRLNSALPTTLSRLCDWYRRVDKVEFWASVVVVAWYAAYVLGA